MLGQQLLVISNRVGQLIMVQVDHAFFISRVDSHAVTGNDTSGDAYYNGIGRYLLQYHAATADFRIIANLEGAQNFGTTGNNHVIANGMMALALFLARTAQGYALIEGNIAAQLGSFANNKAHTMVDEKAGA